MARFSFYDVFVAVLSLITYVADAVTDIWLIVYFFTNGYQIWGSLTLGFVTLATLVMEIFSFHWHVTDKTVTPKIFFIHILFLAPVYRYIQVVRRGLRSRQSGKQQHDIDQAFRELNDVCILRLIETFLESAPQLVLQLYIILSDLKNVGYVVGISSLFSLLSLAWAVTAYTDALHLAYKKLYKRTAASLVIHLAWQTGMIAARVLAIVLFAVAFQAYVAIPLVLHAVLMMLWVLLIKPDFGATRCERGLFIAVSSIIHTFCFLNLKDDHSRWRMSFFYGVTLVENTVFVTLWYFFKSETSPAWLDVVAFVVVFGGFVLGAGCMLLYYGCCHPSGPAPIPPAKPEFHIPPPGPYNKQEDLKPKPAPLFDVTSTSARINQWLNASLDLSKEGLVENPPDTLPGPTPMSGSRNNSVDHGDGPRFISMRSQADDGNDSAFSMSRSIALRPFSDSGVHVLTPASATMEPRSRSGLYTTAEDRSSYLIDNQQSAQLQPEVVMSDQSLVEMFSRCKLDPSFVSNGSFEDSGMFPSRNGDSTGTSGYRTAGSLTSPGCGSGNNTYHEQSACQPNVGSRNSVDSYRDYQNMSVSCDHNVSDLRPAKISPLDPSRLWQEFNERLNYGSDTAINRSLGNNTSMRTVPDHLRGSAGMSLSYSCLNDYTSDTNRFHSLPDGTGLSETASSFFYKKNPNRSQNSLGSSQGVSFSNLSLQLPDSSNKNNHRIRVQNRWRNDGGSYGDIQQPANYGRGDRKSLEKLGDSAQSDRQSAYSSDQGLSSSRGLSSSNSAVERSQQSFTSSGFQSEESNFSDQSPLHPPHLHHHHYHNHNYLQSTPLVENEISTIFSLPSTIRTNRVSLDTDICPPAQQNLDTTPHLGQAEKGKSGATLMPTSSLFPTSNPADISDPHSGSDMSAGLNVGNSSEANSSASSNEDSTCAQATPLLENEISTIPYSLPSTVRTKKVSLDADVCPPSYDSLMLGRKSLGARNNLVNSESNSSPKIDSNCDIGISAIADLGSILPPLTVRSRSSSSDGSTRSGGRFFKNLLTEDTGSPADLSDEENGRYAHSSSSGHRSDGSAGAIERSAISAMIDNMSSSCGGTSTMDSLSMDSSLTSNNRTKQGTQYNRSMLGNNGSKGMSEEELPTYVNIEECSPNSSPESDQHRINQSDPDTSTSSNSSSKRRSRSKGPERYRYLSSDPTEQTKLMELLAEMSNATGEKSTSSSSPGTREYVNMDDLGPDRTKVSHIDILPCTSKADSSPQAGHGVDQFNRDRLRASLDKESQDQLVRDIENMAPRKLYKLKAKAGEPKKKLSPMKISDYTDSPYKFRQPQISEYTDSPYKFRQGGQRLDYENVKSGSLASLGSAFEDIKAVTPALYTDYVNVYDLSGERVGECPMATPESLSDAVILDDNIDISDRLGKTFNVPLEAVRGEFDIDSLSHRSSELSCTKSPINASGVNSAFRPVKSRSSSSSYSRSSTNSISPGAESTSNLSVVSGNRSNVSSDRSSMSECGDFKKPLPYNSSQYSGGAEDSSSFNWSRRSGLDSVSEAADSTYQKLNYLQMVGKDPLSFSTSKFPTADETASMLSKHSYSDSIPWEDSINKSTDYQAPVDQSLPKSSVRKPLTALENTPVFSPIYGGQSIKPAEDLASRKRYMSTPKLNSNSSVSLSETSVDSRSTSQMNNTSQIRDLRNRTFNNTSTWSCQSDTTDNPNNEPLNQSCFSSLSKTTYI